MALAPGTWPRAVTPDMFQREHGGEIPEGILRTVVPAAPCAWISALQRHGTISFAEAGVLLQFFLHLRGALLQVELVAAQTQKIAQARAEFARIQRAGDKISGPRIKRPVAV